MSSGRAPPGLRATVSVSGLPGFILTSEKSTSPYSPSTCAPSRSRSPAETPPDVMSTSASAASARSTAVRSGAAASAQMPKSRTSRASRSSATAARSIGRTASRMQLGGSSPASAASTISSPVETMASFGLGCTNTRCAPTVARMPSSGAPTSSPAPRTAEPAGMSKPTGRMSWPGASVRCTRIHVPPGAGPLAADVRSTSTTESAPEGMGPPVVT
mmetsp:Transcript_30556/g.76554  ORF Transcript_30556/g.76554 Transcript_30556/m.76554 type:complete len:216 (+) Transcript_30556:113-760(+)